MNDQHAESDPTAGLPQRGALRWWHWWPVLLGPATVLLTCVAYWGDWDWFLSKQLHETVALALLAAATAAYLSAAWRGRSPVHVILTVLAAAFLFREIHFVGTSNGVYVVLVVLIAWSWHWRGRLLPATAVGRLRPWLFASVCTYVLAQLVARRVFRGMPLEETLQGPGWLEEAVETMAHAVLLITAFADLFGRRR